MSGTSDFGEYTDEDQSIALDAMRAHNALRKIMVAANETGSVTREQVWAIVKEYAL